MGRFVSSDSVVYSRFCEIINGFTGYAMTRQDFESILGRCGSPYAWGTVRAWLRGLERLGFVYPLYNIDQVRSGANQVWFLYHPMLHPMRSTELKYAKSLSLVESIQLKFSPVLSRLGDTRPWHAALHAINSRVFHVDENLNFKVDMGVLNRIFASHVNSLLAAPVVSSMFVMSLIASGVCKRIYYTDQYFAPHAPITYGGYDLAGWVLKIKSVLSDMGVSLNSDFYGWGK